MIRSSRFLSSLAWISSGVAGMLESCRGVMVGVGGKCERLDDDNAKEPWPTNSDWPLAHNMAF